LSVFNELKRRNVIRVGVAYIVTAWLIIQVVETLFPVFEIGNESVRLIVILLAVGLLPVLFFAWAFELTPEGVKREKDVDRSQSIAPQTGNQIDRWVIAMLVVALTYFILDKFILDPGRDAELIKATSQQTELDVLNRTPEKSIAVLPFVNMSSDPEQEFFSDGITEEILNSLAKVKELKVAGRTSSFAFKGRNEDVREIGELLNVAHVLEGSVRKAGNRIRITAQLIKVDDGYHLWSETFDRELTDVFAIQDEIALAILGQLKTQLLDESPQLVMSTQTDTEVYELYLQARQLMYERKQESIELAAQLLERALSIDPGYAPAHAQLGIATLFLSERRYGDIPHEQARTRARNHLDTALEQDMNLAEAWAGMGLYYDKGKEAVAALENALTINPNLLDALNWLYGAKADSPGAHKIVESILELDPLYIPAIGSAVNNYNKTGQAEKSWALLEKVQPFYSNHPGIMKHRSNTHFFLGQYALGLPLIESAAKQEPNNRVLREILCLAWNSTHQFERTVDLAVGHPAIIAHWQLGHIEQALIIAYEPAAEGQYVEPYFQVLNASGNSHKLIKFLESRWSDLDGFAASFGFNSDMMGYAPLNEIAFAYMRAGESEKAHEALALVFEGQKHLLALGRDNIQFSMNRAVYFALKGDHETALDHLATSIDGGYIGSTRLTKLWPAFEPLEADSRYQAIQKRMITHLNEERKALGLEPIAE
jgi:TolB-like protein/Tfp pilus assembly protein PilF